MQILGLILFCTGALFFVLSCYYFLKTTLEAYARHQEKICEMPGPLMYLFPRNFLSTQGKALLNKFWNFLLASIVLIATSLFILQ